MIGVITSYSIHYTKLYEKVVATGGHAAALAPEVPSIEVVDPVLTLVGLRLIFERNAPSQPPR